MSFKNILKMVISIPVIYYGYFLFNFFYHGHRVTYELDSKYTSLIKAKYIPNILQYPAVKEESKYETINSFHYLSSTDTLYISIWEIKELKNISIEKVFFNKNVDLSDVVFQRGEILNGKTTCDINIKYHPEYGSMFNVDFDKDAQILNQNEGRGYKWIYLQANKVAFSDYERNYQTLISSPNGSNKLLGFLFLEKKGIFYIVFIRSNNTFFDEKVFDIFDI